MDIQPQSPVERAVPLPEALKPAAFEAACESPESAAAFVANDAKDRIVRVKDFTEKVAPELKAQADAIEMRIAGLAKQAEADIADAVAPEQSPAVKVSQTISVGEFPQKVLARMKPEEIAAITARKEISIGGTSGAAVTAEGVEGVAVPPPAESPALIAKRILESRKPNGTQKASEAVESPEEAKNAATESAEQKKRLEMIESEFNALNAEADRLFAAGDRDGLGRIAVTMERTIEAKGQEVIGWKSRNPDLDAAPKDQLIGFLVGRTLLDIQMARCERTAVQIDLLGKRQANAPVEEIAALEKKVGALDAEIKGKIGNVIDLKGDRAAAVVTEAKAQEAKGVKKTFAGDSSEYYGGYGGSGGYGGYGGFGGGGGGESAKAKPSKIADAVKGGLVTVTEGALDVLSSPFKRWISFTATGQSSIIEEIGRWGEELGK